jgi:N-acyl-D-aspartate/D-glutamate deacylase
VESRYLSTSFQFSRSLNYLMPLPSFSPLLAVTGAERAAFLSDPAWRDRARPEAHSDERTGYISRWDRIWVDTSVRHAALIGRPLQEVAAERGVDPFDLMVDLALEENLETHFRVAVRNHDVVELTALLQDHRTVLGAHDAGAHVDTLCDSCFPSHVLSHWVRERKAFGLEEAVWRLSGQPAEIFGLGDRGRIAPGMAEAIAAGPIERVHDFPAAGERLISRNRGISHIWVNGAATRADGVDVEGSNSGVLVH